MHGYADELEQFEFLEVEPLQLELVAAVDRLLVSVFLVVIVIVFELVRELAAVERRFANAVAASRRLTVEHGVAVEHRQSRQHVVVAERTQRDAGIDLADEHVGHEGEQQQYEQQLAGLEQQLRSGIAAGQTGRVAHRPGE